MRIFALQCLLTTSICLVASTTVAQEHETTATPFLFGLGAAGRCEAIVGHAAEDWSPYPTVGVHLDLPIGVPRLHTRLACSAGLLAPVDDTTGIDGYLIDLTWTCTYGFGPRDGWWRLNPYLGLVSTTVIMQSPALGAMEGAETLSESEFGCALGVEPRVTLKRLVLGVPVGLICTLSAPELLLRVTGGITVAYAHYRRGQE
jgi:hypothetical protein